MATKVPKKAMTKDELRDLTKRQGNIIKLRSKLNASDPDDVKTFTKYKIITYFCNIIFPPYSLYRIWCKKSTFNNIEKIIQTTVCIIFMVILLTTVFK